MQKKHITRIGTAAVAVSALTLAISANVFAAANGDVNGDGSVNLADVVAFGKYLTTQDTLTDASAADLNGDGKINSIDYTLVKRIVLNSGSTPDPNPPATDDTYVTQITFGASSVTLKNANDEIVAASDAQNVTVENGTYVTLTMPTDQGDVNVDGECANGQLKVDVDKDTYADSKATINLRGLTLSNQNDSPIYINSIDDEVVITSKKDTVNTISDGTSYTNADGDAGAIYSKDDLKFKGKGTLIVNGNCEDGIVGKDDIKIWNGNIQVNAADDGIRGKDSVRIGDPDAAAEDYESLIVTVKTQGGDGIKSTNDTADSGKGFVRINGGTVKITSYADGIQAEQAVEINDGDIEIYTYEGASYTGSGSTGGNTGGWGGGFGGGMQDGNSNKADISAKGIKAVGLYDEAGTTWQSGGDITVNGGNITIDSSDDSLHCGGNMYLYGGNLLLATADDGCHADHDLTIGQGTAATYDDVIIVVTQGYEGIEAQNILQNSGSVIVNVTDDGYNAAGGSDGSGNGNQGGPGGGWGQGNWGNSGGGSYSLEIKGGFALVNVASGDHDGFDSNGSLIISGGIVITNGNEPFDSDGTLNATGGVWIENSTCNNYMDTQPSYSVNGGSVNAGERITLVGSDGQIIVSFIAGKSVTKLRAGGDVNGATFYTGGTLNGSAYFQTMYEGQLAAYGGTLSGGTQSAGSGATGGR